MSTAEAILPRTRQTQTQVTPAVQAAIVAAVALGRSQVDVAKEFGLHRNTVSKICVDVKKLEHGSNPLSKAWKDPVRLRAIRSVNKGLECQRDPYRAAELGLEVLDRTGDLVKRDKGSSTLNVGFMMQWEAPQDCINVTPTGETHTVQVIDSTSQET